MKLSSSEPECPQFLPFITLLVCGGLAAFTTIAYLLISRSGLHGSSTGVDWAHHMSLLDVLSAGVDPLTRREQLWEFAEYPRLSYKPAVWISRIFSISTLQSYQIVAITSNIATAILSSALLVFMIGYRRTAAAFGATAAAAVIFFFSYWGFSFFGQVVHNGFFSQSVGTTFAFSAFWCMVLLAARSQLAALCVLVPLASGLTAAFHLTPALWLAGSGLVLILSCSGDLRRLALVVVSTASLTGVLIYFAPGTAMTLTVAADTNGSGYLGGNGIRINDRLDILLVAYGILASGVALLCVASLRQLSWRRFQSEVLFRQAGTLGVLGVGAVIAVQYLIAEPLEYYSLAKYAHIYVPHLALVVASIVALCSSAFLDRNGPKLLIEEKRTFWATGMVVVIAFAQLAFIPTGQPDQSRMIAVQQSEPYNLPGWSDKGPVFPNFSALLPDQQYYTAISILQYPRSVLAPILPAGGIERVPFGPRILHPARLNGAVETWPGHRLHVSSREIDRYLATRLFPRGPEAWGRWVPGRRVEYLGRVATSTEVKGICIETVVGPVDLVPQTEQLTVSLDAGGGTRFLQFDSDRRSAIAFVPLPAYLPRTGEFVLAIENVENSLGEVEEGSPLIGVGLISMWLAQSACE